jgi:hypothetical protein
MRQAFTSLLILLAASALPLRAACGAGSVDMHVVDHYFNDKVLHRRWAVIVDCSHPERPWTMEEVTYRQEIVTNTPHLSPIDARLSPRIAAGAVVEIWKVDAGGNIHLRGVALDAAAEGQEIHVRLQHSTAVLEGRVRGVASVELLTQDRWKSQ